MSMQQEKQQQQASIGGHYPQKQQGITCGRLEPAPAAVALQYHPSAGSSLRPGGCSAGRLGHSRPHLKLHHGGHYLSGHHSHSHNHHSHSHSSHHHHHSHLHLNYHGASYSHRPVSHLTRGSLSPPTQQLELLVRSGASQQQANYNSATGASQSTTEATMSPSDALSSGINLEQYISKRNERERSRVRNVNDAFDNLKNSLPLNIERLSKRMSKVEILRTAISYIKSLDSVLGYKQQQQQQQQDLQQEMLTGSGQQQQQSSAVTMRLCGSPYSSGSSQSSSSSSSSAGSSYSQDTGYHSYPQQRSNNQLQQLSSYHHNLSYHNQRPQPVGGHHQPAPLTHLQLQQPQSYCPAKINLNNFST